MANSHQIIPGVIHGKTIELESNLGLPDGQQVSVLVQPMLSPEEAIRQSFGGWADDALELDQFLKQVRMGRQQVRTEPE